MPSDGYTMVKILVYLPALVMGVYLIFGVIRLIRNSRAESVTVSAEVVGKRRSRVKPLSNKIRFPQKVEYNHYARFRMVDGSCMELPVPEEAYDRLREGDKGSLTYRGMQYIGFA